MAGDPLEIRAALARFAPVVLQQQAIGLGRGLDRPVALDADGSGHLEDDLAAVAGGTRSAEGVVPFYASATEDAERLYLFYGLYYAADWSGDPTAPHIDHRGDFEGALVVVTRAAGRVEAVVTQAHRRFYLWERDPARHEPTSSGVVAVADGRPVLFAESGGHGLYAFGAGRWRPRGGAHYPNGPAALPPSRLLRIGIESDAGHLGPSAHADLRALDDLRRFTRGPDGPFRDLTKALPPWLWADRRGGSLGQPGAIVRDSGRLYAALRAHQRP